MVPFWNHNNHIFVLSKYLNLMANLTIKGISDETLSRLRQKAFSNSRSMNKEIIELLTKYAYARIPDVKHLLKTINEFKPLFKGSLSSTVINNAIRKSRK
jgi:type IV secretory pathway VirB4 component